MEISKTIRKNLFANLGIQLRNIRLEKGWDLQQAADVTHFNPAKLKQMEKGKYRWGHYNLDNLAYLIAHYDKILKIEFINPPEILETPQPAEFTFEKICS